MSNKYSREVTERFLSRIEILDDDSCSHWKGRLDRGGYGVFTTEGKTEHAHRVAWRMHYGEEIPPGMCICHHCDVRSCCNGNHLFLGTIAENNQDCVNKGRNRCKEVMGDKYKGSVHSMAILSEADALEIREQVASSAVSLKSLAERYGVSYAAVYDISSGRSWKHVGGELTVNRYKGEIHHSSKLTARKVRTLRAFHQTGLFTHQQLGQIYEVNPAQITKIVNRKQWKHV